MNRTLSLIVSIAMLCITAYAPAAEAAQNHGSGRGRSIGYMPEISFGGSVAAHRDEKVLSWNTTCTSSAYASVNGGLRLSIQEKVPGGWKVRAAGVYAQVPDLGPGTYRIVITNASAMSTAYTIRHRRGMG